jgi:hypothetical protein
MTAMTIPAMAAITTTTARTTHDELTAVHASVVALRLGA